MPNQFRWLFYHSSICLPCFSDSTGTDFGWNLPLLCVLIRFGDLGSLNRDQSIRFQPHGDLLAYIAADANADEVYDRGSCPGCYGGWLHSLVCVSLIVKHAWVID